MKIRQAKKILNMMERGTDTRYFESKYTFKEESRFIPRLKNLYQKATIRWNKVNMPSANVSLFRSILRISKECGYKPINPERIITCWLYVDELCPKKGGNSK